MEKEKIGVLKSLALLLLLILVSIFLGVNFWFLFIAAGIFVLLRYIGVRFITNIVVVLLFIIIIPIAIKSFLPRTADSMKHTNARVDQLITNLLPEKVEVDVVDIFSQEKKIAAKKFTLMYQDLLKKGKVKEANDSLISFEKKWGPQKVENSTAETLVVDSTYFPERVYSMGTYEIVVEGETPFYIVINFKRDVKNGFRFKSESNNFMLILEDGSIVKTDAELPYRDVYKIRLKTTLPKEVVTLRVY